MFCKFNLKRLTIYWQLGYDTQFANSVNWFRQTYSRGVLVRGVSYRIWTRAIYLIEYLVCSNFTFTESQTEYILNKFKARNNMFVYSSNFESLS